MRVLSSTHLTGSFKMWKDKFKVLDCFPTISSNLMFGSRYFREWTLKKRYLLSETSICPAMGKIMQTNKMYDFPSCSSSRLSWLKRQEFLITQASYFLTINSIFPSLWDRNPSLKLFFMEIGWPIFAKFVVLYRLVYKCDCYLRRKFMH